jgi:hypothetical protein
MESKANWGIRKEDGTEWSVCSRCQEKRDGKVKVKYEVAIILYVISEVKGLKQE